MAIQREQSLTAELVASEKEYAQRLKNQQKQGEEKLAKALQVFNSFHIFFFL